MSDLFNKEMVVCLHKSSQTEIIIKSTEWYKGRVNYNCLVPQKNEKGKWQLCNATYDEDEVEFLG